MNEFKIEIKQNDLVHVDEKIQDRYINFFSSIGLPIHKLSVVKDEIFKLLKSDTIYEREEEYNLTRCSWCQKVKIKAFSLMLNTEVFALVFQDSTKKIRYVLTVYSSSLESTLSGYET